MITQAELKNRLNYDPITGVFTWKIANGNRVAVGDVAGSYTGHGYIRIIIDKKSYRAHRLAWLYMTGNWPSDQIDHINHKRDDNRFCNLRECSNSENSQNRSKQSNNKSGCVGISWVPNRNKWAAYIDVDGKRISLGRYETLEKAKQVRLDAEKQYHPYSPDIRP